GIGIEQGLMKSVCDRVNSFDSEGRLDFIIGSSHLVNGADPYYPEFWEGFDVRKGILTYYESILENVNVCSNYDVYGHIDYIIRYIPKNRTEEYHEADYNEVIDELLSCIIRHAKGIEINTARIKYGLGQPNPSEFIIKRYRELGGEIITTGSDAHKPEHIAFSFDRLASILKNASFNYYTTFRKRTPEFIRID
ncbi:MAG: PHP domain-containing protein, partial [Clostridia bacterium]|nr:PHP domain-containing protein [Clostridia bacterium]